MKKLCLVFNPGASAADEMMDLRRLLAGGSRLEVCTLDDSSVAGLVERLRDGAWDRVLVAGGDGSLNRLVSALAPDFPQVEIAVLPSGTGNDLVRSLGYDSTDPEEICGYAVDGPATPVDVVHVESADRDLWYVNVANGGVGGRVAEDLGAESKERFGPLAYWVSGVAAVVDPEVYSVELTFGREGDGEQEKVRHRLIGLVVANGRYVGGGFPVARAALLDDALLDLTAVPPLPSLDLIAAGTSYALGREYDEEQVLTFRAERVRVRAIPAMPFSVDGEPWRCSDATFEVMPGALRLVRGHGESALSDPR